MCILYSENSQNIEKLLNLSGKTRKAHSNLPEFHLVNGLKNKKIEKGNSIVFIAKKLVTKNLGMAFRSLRARS